MTTNFQLFLYTVDEYKRFANHLSVKKLDSLSDGYSEADYIGIQVRLMLLRKYYSNTGNVSFKRIISEAENIFPNVAIEFQELSAEFDKIQKQNLEHLLADGTKLDIYTTIEDSVYGLYLHADENRIYRLENTTEAIRFVCTRKYILEIEHLIFKLYDLLKICGVTSQIIADNTRSPMIYLGDKDKNIQGVTGSPYWSNIYGVDVTDNDMKKIEQEITLEEKKMLYHCIMFIRELNNTQLKIRKLKKYIHPVARRDWRNFVEAKTFICNIPNLGFSTKVRYNEEKDTAYIRVYPKVEDPFLIDTPHIFSEGYEFALGKWFGKWLIYSFGDHIDSIYEKRKKK